MEMIKKEFPIFQKTAEKLVYLDNASTTQKPAMVLDAMRDFYECSNANVHRGVYGLAERADATFEGARGVCADFVGAQADEIVFVKNATEAANLVAFAYGDMVVGADDNVVVTELEHHSNWLPWQQLCLRKGAQLRVVPIIVETGELNWSEMLKMVDQKTRIIAVTQMSNVLGVKPDLKKVVTLAKSVGAKVMVDAAQGIGHGGLNVVDLDCDFAMVSGHKLFGPMGSGFLFGRKELLAGMNAFMTGGGMVREILVGSALWLESPAKFEAGTPDVAGAVGLATAIKFLGGFDFAEIVKHDQKLVQLARLELSKLKRVRLFGPEEVVVGNSILSFLIDGVHPHDIASVLAEDGVCIRAGHHCAKPLMKALGVNATARASFSIYNSEEDVMDLVKGVEKVLSIFK